MTTPATITRRTAPPWVVAGVVALLAVVLLLWAKWLPYAAKVPTVAGSGSLGSSIVTGGAAAPPAVSLSAGLAFARTYFLAIWTALVAGLVLAAAVRTVLPRDWVARAAGVAPTIAAALLLTLPAVSLPSLLLVRRVFPGRLLVTVAVVVVLVGVASAVVVAAGGSWAA